MKTRPILFNTEMVYAILAGHKTQTRRIIKPQPERGRYNYEWRPNRRIWMAAGSEKALALQMVGHCPYGFVGDSLWVRETWADDSFDHEYGTEKLARYKADVPNGGGPWFPSIHMPRWASRVTLELTDVRAERVQEISSGDVGAEGIQANKWTDDCPWDDCRMRFPELWNSIAKRGFGWSSNPWIWVLEFECVEMGT